MSDTELKPLHPREAMEMWLDRQRSERAEETLQSYFYRLNTFVEWCEENGFDNLNDLTGRDMFKYDSHRRSLDLSQSTLNNQLGTLRQFISFCADIEAVDSELPLKVDVPQLTKKDRTNEEKLSTERAEVLLEDLKRYRRASRDHALFLLAWHTCARLGGLRSLDVQDCYLSEDDLERLRHQDDVDDEILEEVSIPFIYFRHRSSTPLKNQEEGERPVAISEEVADFLDEYIRVNRVAGRDEDGREPLFSTKKGEGRMTKGALRSRMNIMTQPCRFGHGCPHGREIESCEARRSPYESRCPSSRSPHRVRTGAITHHLDCGWPIEQLAERVNATPQVIRDHYDQPDLLKRMESRRSHLDRLDGEDE
ncbi:Site-specific recombinase XerD [Halogranum gelatinilyticum]|uniref:Site-specific recombinase XerD n=1 Tax=Halogranum gelatinilyticum TaxID=660521 RepID=A0A1G9TG15_9EURY|nr:site-specific integrase [Halogranum gelatinilyticum]SDM46691.1 Site-specific recombinase XerD [Halogranum gelatinilyticum]